MRFALRSTVVACGVLVAARGEGREDGVAQLSPATGGTLSSCAQLKAFLFPHTAIASAESVASGTLSWGGSAIASHCLVKGEMHRRTSPEDGKSYAIGFEMRLPTAWNGRFFYQANGGSDGSITTALGGGGPMPTTALQQGFAVISSDAGHSGSRDLSFGLDFQARLDYGYQAAAKLTPMAKALIATAYGKRPDRSYFGGCSNGGRHTFVAMTRMPEEYDGYLAGAPGYRLPLAAIANQFGAKRYATVATNSADLGTAFTAAERAKLSAAVLARCDALDGANDGLIQDTDACQRAFDFDRDVPTCSGARDGSCLSEAQKTAIAPIFSGAVDGKGDRFYASFPFDSGHNSADSSFWEFFVPLTIDSGATAMIWGVPPADPATFNGSAYALSTPSTRCSRRWRPRTAPTLSPALAFMQPRAADGPHQAEAARGQAHGLSRGERRHLLGQRHHHVVRGGASGQCRGDASDFARFFRVPGMAHCAGGPSTDQFDMLTALVDWVEKGRPPDQVTAYARGAGNAVAVNTDVPSSWSPRRSRPLCPYPRVARLRAGATDIETAESFSCR